jgi:hypothetical protein
MKSLKLAVIVSAVMLSVAGLAQAESANVGHEDSANSANSVNSADRVNKKFMSKRSKQLDHHTPEKNAKSTKGDEHWEGAALKPEEGNSATSNNANNPKKQGKVKSLSRRHQ